MTITAQGDAAPTVNGVIRVLWKCAGGGGDTPGSPSGNTTSLPPQPSRSGSTAVCSREKIGPSHLTQIQGDIHLVVDQPSGEGGALPPPLGPIDGAAHRVGVAGVFGVAVAAVLTLNSRFVWDIQTHLHRELKQPAHWLKKGAANESRNIQEVASCRFYMEQVDQLHRKSSWGANGCFSSSNLQPWGEFQEKHADFP